MELEILGHLQTLSERKRFLLSLTTEKLLADHARLTIVHHEDGVVAEKDALLLPTGVRQ